MLLQRRCPHWRRAERRNVQLLTPAEAWEQRGPPSPTPAAACTRPGSQVGVTGDRGRGREHHPGGSLGPGPGPVGTRAARVWEAGARRAAVLGPRPVPCSPAPGALRPRSSLSLGRGRLGHARDSPVEQSVPGRARPDTARAPVAAALPEHLSLPWEHTRVSWARGPTPDLAVSVSGPQPCLAPRVTASRKTLILNCPDDMELPEKQWHVLVGLLKNVCFSCAWRSCVSTVYGEHNCYFC